MTVCDSEEYRAVLGFLLALGNRELGPFVYPNSERSESLDNVKMSKKDFDLENHFCGGL